MFISEKLTAVRSIYVQAEAVSMLYCQPGQITIGLLEGIQRNFQVLLSASPSKHQVNPAPLPACCMEKEPLLGALMVFHANPPRVLGLVHCDGLFSLYFFLVHNSTPLFLRWLQWLGFITKSFHELCIRRQNDITTWIVDKYCHS